ncbi:coenzyme F420-0:L-glutamate ligase [Acuticoccus kandeliae]|uniref:coenzyme F420-0:L-glutamate ligase n=1 Tax=Acuticoccus kandeliae TaxID=2073160 RepID=UPI000D3E4821|nr:coenzyme F420-0:L-glutamate ligase [Acuticoccus kandeliae]
MAGGFSVHVLRDIPLVATGDDLAAIAMAAMEATGLSFEDGDILVLCHKIVSKAEGRGRRLASVRPGEVAQDLARVTGKDPALCELVLSESRSVLRQRPGVVIARNRLGHVVANAAVDQSNTGEDGLVLLLPEDPDASAMRLRAKLEAATGRRLGILVTDSFGRAWRIGTLGTAIGQSGPPAFLDQRGGVDLCGRTMQSTMPAIADALAAAAVLALGEADEGTPMALIRGFAWRPSPQRAADAIRPEAEDMFL